jgi:hypothetical protein
MIMYSGNIARISPYGQVRFDLTSEVLIGFGSSKRVHCNYKEYLHGSGAPVTLTGSAREVLC